MLIGGWLLYFLLHSLLASLAVKYWVAQRWPALLPAYRLMFNAISLLSLLPLLYLLYAFPGPEIWAWRGVGWVLVNLLALASVAGFVWSMRYYDGEEFIGLRQWRQEVRSVEDQEHLHISPLHRYVRHPWYFLGLVLVWTRDMSQAFLISALMITLYFIVGSWLEERKLMVYHGERYRRYREQVPGLIPLPWKHLSREQAGDILKGL
jgi:protein-S-isoprenylcysteine O-methyltransferase Ste14